MKERTVPLQLKSPLPTRYWAIELEGRGTHVFRHPYYGVAAAVADAMQLFKAPEPDERPMHDKAISMLPAAGMMIGACWHHPIFELEAKLPLANLTSEALIAYGHEVCEELQEADYNLLDILNLFGVVGKEMAAHQDIVKMAMERATFTDPPEAGSTH